MQEGVKEIFEYDDDTTKAAYKLQDMYEYCEEA